MFARRHEPPAPRISRIVDALARLQLTGSPERGLAGRAQAERGLLPAAPGAVASEEALRLLQEGNARYAADMMTNKDFSAGRVARAQSPFASILSCADSRLAPELVFDQGPGALFVIRVAGNFVNEDGLASLEFGAVILGIPLIMVLGHSDCGAVKTTITALAQGAQLPGHLPSLVDAIRPAVARAHERRPIDLLAEATRENVRRNVQLLQGASPIISERIASGLVKVVGGFYDIATGNVSMVS
jgi:carbonic anhydrase